MQLLGEACRISQQGWVCADVVHSLPDLGMRHTDAAKPADVTL